MDHEHLVLLHDKLVAWKPENRNFHKDRQLADEMLLACGWRCMPAPEHANKVKWQFGTNPIVTIWEPYHPHPINSVDSALGQVPYGYGVSFYDYVSGSGPILKVIACYAQVSNNIVVGRGNSEERSVAICIAIVRALIEADAMETQSDG